MQRFLFDIRFVLLITLFLSPGMIWGQLNPIHPENFSGFFNTPFLVNPSYIPLSGDYNLGFSYRSRRIASDVATMAFYVEKIARIKNSSHLFRGIFLNEKSGPYISSPRAYFNYGGGIMLGKETYLYAGLLLGIVSVNYTPPSGSASAMASDGAIGVGLRRKNLLFGLSSFQIFNSATQILSKYVTFSRYYVANMNTSFSLSPATDLKLYTLWRHYNNIPDQFNVGAGLAYTEILEGGIIYEHNQGVVYYGSVEFNKENNPLYLYLSYNSAMLSQGGIVNESYEISIKYTINKKKKEVRDETLEP